MKIQQKRELKSQRLARGLKAIVLTSYKVNVALISKIRAMSHKRVDGFGCLSLNLQDEATPSR